jgi:hypothetical protein
MNLKKLVVIFCLAVMLTACGGATVNGVMYDSYGLANEDTHKNPNINYEVSVASVVLGIILCETIIVPVYIIGWDLMKPVGPKIDVDPNMKGVIK